jgi:hypothetical protein
MKRSLANPDLKGVENVSIRNKLKEIIEESSDNQRNSDVPVLPTIQDDEKYSK